jgi:hypothetical protein
VSRLFHYPRPLDLMDALRYLDDAVSSGRQLEASPVGKFVMLRSTRDESPRRSRGFKEASCLP